MLAEEGVEEWALFNASKPFWWKDTGCPGLQESEMVLYLR